MIKTRQTDALDSKSHLSKFVSLCWSCFLICRKNVAILVETLMTKTLINSALTMDCRNCVYETYHQSLSAIDFMITRAKYLRIGRKMSISNWIIYKLSFKHIHYDNDCSNPTITKVSNNSRLATYYNQISKTK